MMASRPITSWQIDGEEMENFHTVHGVLKARILKWFAIPFSSEQPRQHIKMQRHYFAKKGPSSQTYGFPCSHVWM